MSAWAKRAQLLAMAALVVAHQAVAALALGSEYGLGRPAIVRAYLNAVQRAGEISTAL